MIEKIEPKRITVELSEYKGLNTTTPSGYPDLYAIADALTQHPDRPIEGVIIHTGEEPLPLRPIKVSTEDRSV